MARIETDPNYSSPTFARATAPADPFKKEDVQALAAAMSTHDHSSGKGLSVAAALPDGSIANAKLGPDVARANLLTNGSFDVWQRGPGPFTANGAYNADGWSTSIAGTDTLSVSRSTAADVLSTACALATFTLGTGGGSTDVRQQLKPAENALFGVQLSFGAKVKTSTANAVRLMLFSDGSGGPTVFSSFHTGNGAFQQLSATATIPGDATLVLVAIRFAASCTAYIDNATLVVGSQPSNYAPLHPADDLARCLRYYEVSDSSPIVSGYGAAGGQTGWADLPFKAVKAVMPTVTLSGFSNSNSPNAAASALGIWGQRVGASSSAAGPFFSAFSFTAESNP